MRPLLLSILILLLTAPLSGCRSDQQRLEDFLSRGDAQAAKRAFREAALEYKNAIQIDPNHALAHWRLAEVLLDQGAVREGLWEVREAVRLDPTNREATLRLAQLLILSRDLDEGLATLDRVLAEDPMSAQATLLRAQALEAKNELEPALDAYRAGLALAQGTDDEASALRLLASYHTRRGDPISAGPYYERLVEIDGDSASWIAMAQHHRRVGKAAEAELAHRKSVEVAKPRERVQAYAALAGFLYESDQIAEGVKVLQEGIGAAEESLDLTYLLARFYNLQGAHELADELIRKSAAAATEDVRPHLVLSSYEAGRGRPAEALAAVEKALTIDPKNLEALIWRAELLVDRGQRDQDEAVLQEARKRIDEILGSQPDQPEALVVRAKIELAQAHPKEALEALTVAIAARPDWAIPHHRAATVHAMLGDWPASRAEAARAIELDPTLVDARAQLVRAHQALGEHEYAIEAAQKALRDRPDDVELRTRLAESLFASNRRKEAAEALALVPESLRTPEVHFARAQLELAEGRSAEARAIFAQALRQRPTSPEILQSLLALDARDRKLDESVARIREAIRIEPDNARRRR
ncbi:tetratricopeptide repeat protein, partial [Myxococcota bacterium]|nr:tetratricopeptide repeat protein [Myxococcota bacterium]